MLFCLKLKDKMRATGTLHLTALSGYNITILVNFLIFLLAGLIAWRWQLAAIAIFLILFVVMTGAEASVTRAAIMASILIFANRFNRSYRVYLIILLTAFIMVLFNPRILVWDVGFQLSFLSLLGLIYLSPIITEKLKLDKGKKSFWNWRENFSATVSAMLAVLPLSLFYFKSFSVVGILTNVIILFLIPITMFLGFVLNLLAPLSYWLSMGVAKILGVFLGAELFIIEIFSKIPLQISLENLSVIVVVVYYILIIYWIVRFNLRKNAQI